MDIHTSYFFKMCFKVELRHFQPAGEEKVSGRSSRKKQKIFLLYEWVQNIHVFPCIGPAAQVRDNTTF